MNEWQAQQQRTTIQQQQCYRHHHRHSWDFVIKSQYHHRRRCRLHPTRQSATAIAVRTTQPVRNNNNNKYLQPAPNTTQPCLQTQSSMPRFNELHQSIPQNCKKKKETRKKTKHNNDNHLEEISKQRASFSQGLTHSLTTTTAATAMAISTRSLH